MTWDDKRLEALIAKLEESKFDETTILMISRKSNKFMTKLMLCMELVDNFEESLRDDLDHYSFEDLGNKYEITFEPSGFGDTEVYTRSLFR
tara:strand:+ start:294 stop:566 length:273 start_codon:yes stop_codon:yes gene_type:complete